MGEIRIVYPGKPRGYPYPVCKKRIVCTGENCGYLYMVCKKNPSITAIQEKQTLSMTATEKGGKNQRY